MLSFKIGYNGWRLPHWRYKSRKDFFSNQAKRNRNDKISTDAPLRQPRVGSRASCLLQIEHEVRDLRINRSVTGSVADYCRT
jgi:hypothetical protein